VVPPAGHPIVVEHGAKSGRLVIAGVRVNVRKVLSMGLGRLFSSVLINVAKSAHIRRPVLSAHVPEVGFTLADSPEKDTGGER